MYYLTPREEKVLELRKQGKSLEEVGKEFGVTRERIRQIEAKALRRIENARARRLESVSSNFENAIKYIKENLGEYEIDLFDAAINTIQKEYQKLDLITKVLTGEISQTDFQQDTKNVLDEPLSYLDLSVRSYNCLRRYFVMKNFDGEPKVRDLCKLNSYEMFKIRNLGRKSILEIREKLDSLNLTYNF